MKTTIDDLLVKNFNLWGAVSILIDSAIDNHDFKALYKWDELRSRETEEESQIL